MLCKKSSSTKFDSGIHDLAVCKTLLLCTYTYWTLADAWVKKDEHLENQKLWVHVIFSSSKCWSFSTQRFLYIFDSCGPWCAVHIFVFWIFQPVYSFTLFKMKTSAFVNLMKGIHLCTILPGFTQGDQY